MHLPDVRINALALRNLNSLPFKQLRASSGDAPPTLSARARWLEHGLGPGQALTTAATAALAQSVPSALVAPVRGTPASRKDGSLPAIWIFGSHASIDQATELLGDAFSVVQDGVWSPCGPRAQTDALFDAISRAIMAALEADGAIRVGADIVDTVANLSYRFNLVLTSSTTPTIILRVTVHQSDLRQLDDEDTIAVLQEEEGSRPFPVIVSPLALHATLSKRRIAGDALSASVLARWQEAGLLPSGTLKDSAVVFLSLGSGLDVPFPRACVLTSVKKERIRLEKSSISNTHPRGVSLNPRRDREVLWRSRKRPRSPSIVVEEREKQRLSTSVPPFVKPVVKSESVAKVSHSNPVLEAASKIAVLNASMFNNALVRAGTKDPTPVLNHPLARTPAPSPPLEQSLGSKTLSSGLIEKSSTQQLVGSTAKPASTGMELSGRGFGKTGNQPSDLENIFGGSGNMNMDMADVGSLDDELEFDDLFGGGMDIGGGTSEPSFSALESTANRNVTSSLEGNTSQSRNKKGALKPTSTESNQKNALVSRLSSTPARSTVPGLGVRSSGIEKQRSPASSISPGEILQQVLSSFAAVPDVTERPADADRDAQLKSFYEEDFTKRVTASLRSKPTISHLTSRNVVCPSDSRYVPNYTKYGSLESIRKLLNTKYDSKTNLKVRQKYVPKRRLAVYNSLAKRKTTSSEIKREVSKYSTQLDASSDEESESEEEVDSMPNSAKNENANSTAKKEHSTVLHKDGADSLLTKDSVESINTADAVKVAQNVAVDCASACLVLIDEYQRTATNLNVGTPRNQLLSGSMQSGSNVCAAIGNGGPSHCLDEKVATQIGNGTQSNPIVASPASSKLHLHGNSFNRSHPLSTAGVGNQKCVHKKEKDANALLALLQMQCISVKGLHLFTVPEEGRGGLESTADSTVDKSSRNTPTLTYKSMEPNPVSSAMLRRVLHGFSRTVECSKALRNYAVNSGSDGASLQVTGPLKVSDVYGDGSEIVCLAAPQVCVGFNNEWMETSGRILPLWEKSGLEPYSEKKHVMYTILAPKSSEEDARVFFRDVSAAYEECSFGKHTPLPGDLINCVAISQPAAKPKKLPDGNELSAEDTAMIQQFGLAVTSLGNKLTSMRKSEDSASNLVVYVVSPFRRGANAANSALLRTIAPLLHSIPGIVCSTINNSSANTQTPPTAWRSQSGIGNGLSLHVRVVPCDAIDRRMSCWMKADTEIGIAPRPQLVKGLAFSVYSSLRSKRLGNHGVGFDKESTTGIALSPDNQMSPMTPDLVATPHSPGGSPNGPSIEEGGTYSQSALNNQLSTAAIDQSSALWPSFLHEPAVVLAGVGRQLGQTQPGQQDNNETTSMVLHLAYGFCKEASRFVFAWTDSRGEMLDLASVPVLGNGCNGTRRQAFWCMWLRGQRWKLPYVEQLHVTISKLGEMDDGEVEDWDRVTCRILYGSVNVSAGAEERAGVVRRFNDVDVYMDHPTPATPATSQHHGTPVNLLRSEVMDAQPHGIKSITLCAVQDGAGDRLLMNDVTSGAMRDFVCVAETPVYGERHILGKALLGSADETGVGVLEVDVMLHYGESNRGKQGWDGETASEIARTVAHNFHALRFVGSPPCWPLERWRNSLPIHLELVRNFHHHIRSALFINSTNSFR